MTGSMNDLYTSVAQINPLSVIQGFERCIDICSPVQTVFCANLLREGGTSRPVIGMNVGIYNVGDHHTLRSSESGIRIRVFFTRINDGALAKCAASEEVGRTAGLEIVVGSKVHRSTSTSPYRLFGFHGKSGGLPLRKAFEQAPGTAAVGAEKFNGAIGIHTIRTSAIRDVLFVPW